MRPTLRQRLRYGFDNTMSRGTPALVGWLAVVTALLIGGISAIVLIGKFGPKGNNGHRSGVIDQLFRTMQHAIDSGTVAGDTGKWPFLLVMTLMTFAGLFIVSSLIGVIANGVDAKLQDLRKGRSFVIESNHTLILGWSETIYTILSELEIANASEKDPVIVILAERDKVEMEDAIREKLGDTGRTRVVCRTGSPIDLADLGIVNPRQARSVIVLAPEQEDPDSYVIKTILALTRGPQRREEPYHIVAEINEPQNLEAARLVGGSETVLIDKQETIARLIVQTARQSGVSIVYTELMDFDGDEIYFRADPALVGKTFGDALMAYEDCTVIGLQIGGERVTLNPPADTRIGEGDSLIAIAEDDASLVAATPLQAQVDEAVITPAPPARSASQDVLVLGWNKRAPAVIAELDNYVAPGSAVTLMADGAGPDEAAMVLLRERLRNLTVDYRRGNTTDRRTLDALGVERFEQVIVMCYSDVLDAQRADARTLVTLLHLRDIAASNGNGPGFTVVSEMLDDRNRELAQVTKVDDVIVSDKLISLILAQVSENPHLEDVFAELFRAEGSELYMRPATDYVARGASVSFATVVEAARRRDEVAIGFRLADGFDDPARDYGVRVNPPKSAQLTAGDRDRIVVLAED